MMVYNMDTWVTLKELDRKAKIKSILIEKGKVRFLLEGYEGRYEIDKIIVKKIK